MAAIGATHPGETFAQVAALEIVPHDVPDDQPEIAVRLGEPLFIMLFEAVVMIVEQLPERRLVRFARVVNGRFLCD